MMHNMGSLYDELHRSLLNLNKLIEAQEEMLTDQVNYAVVDGKQPISIYKLVDGNGRSSLADLTIARAQVLSGMAALKAADVASKNVPPRSRR